MNVLGHLAWKKHAHSNMREWARIAAIVALVLVGLFLLVGRAYAQFSKINWIDYQQNGSDVAFVTYPDIWLGASRLSRSELPRLSLRRSYSDVQIAEGIQ